MRPLPLAAALTALALSAAAGPVPSPAQRELVRAEGHRRPVGPVDVPHAAQADVDVTAYDLRLFLDVANERIEGENDVTFLVAPGRGSADALVLDLHDNLAVTGIDLGGTPLPPGSWTRAGSRLDIPLTPPAAEGGPATTVTVRYEGAPRELAFGTLTFDTHGDPPQPMVFTLSEPDLGRGWWPCKDVPDDKALVRVSVEAPATLTVVSNGTRESVVSGRAGHSITTWSSRYPIATYLVSVSATDYVTWSDSYTSQDGSKVMPVEYWAWPEREAAARNDWGFTPDVLDYFARAFYEYPFLDDKYGTVMIPLWGAMEHTTCTSYGAQVVPGNRAYDFIVVHELAHHWWGDDVGPRDWDSIWLNEGFASYSEALWVEHVAGRAAYLDYLRSMDRVQQGQSEFPGTVHAPDAYFNSTVYDKGGWVLHMLRWVAGQPATSPDQEVVLRILREHGREHPLGIASTSDFVATASRLTGQDLQWFFDEWVHRPGRPDYRVGWAAAPQAGGGFVVHLRVEQAQGGPPFRMPVLVRLRLPSGDQDVIVPSDTALQDWQFPTTEVPTAVEWDPDGWVLKRVSALPVDRDGDGWPDWLDGCPDVPDPAQADSDGDTVADACEPGVDFDGDGVANASDCLPADAGAWAPAPGPASLRARRGPLDDAVLSFVTPDPAGQRDYAVDVGAMSLAQLRSERSLGSLACAATVAPGATWLDASAATPQGRAYLAWPWNGCLDPAALAADPCR